MSHRLREEMRVLAHGARFGRAGEEVETDESRSSGRSVRRRMALTATPTSIRSPLLVEHRGSGTELRTTNDDNAVSIESAILEEQIDVRVRANDR